MPLKYSDLERFSGKLAEVLVVFPTLYKLTIFKVKYLSILPKPKRLHLVLLHYLDEFIVFGLGGFIRLFITMFKLVV